VAGLLAGVVSFGMSGCGASDFTSSSLATLVPTSSQPVVTTKAKAKATATATATAASTSTLGVLPPVLSTSSSPVDAAVVTSLADLPAAFGCPKVPQPIVVPASGDKPPALVCRSELAEEALFLWYVDDADSKYRAVKAALATACRAAGRHWVAGGMVDDDGERRGRRLQAVTRPGRSLRPLAHGRSPRVVARLVKPLTLLGVRSGVHPMALHRPNAQDGVS
jgi:hypothetical protein